VKNEARMAEKTYGEGLFAKVSALIDEYLDLHRGDTFNDDKLFRDLEITSRDARKEAQKKLSYLVKEQVLKKDKNAYIYINRDITYIPWYNCKEDYIKLVLPSSHHPDDLTYFGFEDVAKFSPGSLIVIAGVSNAGKSTLCRNILWDNMHTMKSVYFSSETTGPAFKRYAQVMNWQDPFKDGKPVFELVERYRDYEDVIRNGWLNLIDWLDIEDGEFFKIGNTLSMIKEKNPLGITVVAIQKDANKELGRGASFSKEKASLYMTLDYDKDHELYRLTIEKCKEWVGAFDPNHKTYGFQITEAGTQFSNIRELKKCPECHGYGSRGKNDCMRCNGTGWTDGYVSKRVENGIEF
jgi:hypothetical protein